MEQQSQGVGFCGLLTILFIALKLLGFINWSWIWVLAPMWIGFALIGIISLIIMIFTIAIHYNSLRRK